MVGTALATELLERVTVVIRSVRERTEEACRALILEQGVLPNSVFVVRERPFSKTLRVGSEVGLQQGRPWTLFVDADLLLRAGSIEKMVRRAESASGRVCEIQGYCLDKFFGGVRAGGVHLYRTSLLEEFILSIPEEATAIRPESRALELMAAKGFLRLVVPELIGLHDFDQRNEDIFRKCFVHARKHETYIPLFISFWRSRAESDYDFRVALSGLAAGIQHLSAIDIDFEASYYKDAIRDPQFREKDSSSMSGWTLEKVESTISSWKEPELLRNYKPFGMIASDANLFVVFRSLFRKQSVGRSLPKALLATIAIILRRAGSDLTP